MLLHPCTDHEEIHDSERHPRFGKLLSYDGREESRDVKPSVQGNRDSPRLWMSIDVLQDVGGSRIMVSLIRMRATFLLVGLLPPHCQLQCLIPECPDAWTLHPLYHVSCVADEKRANCMYCLTVSRWTPR